jgi:SAM-dependent methyltransferase
MLAHEYYDATRHPTCANFREASRIFLREALKDTTWPVESVLELGAGKSIMAEIVIEEKDERPRTFSITDASCEMLEYSRHWEDLGAKLQVADALALPYKAGTYSLIVASLADPYNQSALWAEVARVLSKSGRFVFTCPSYGWAISFRKRTDCPTNRAEFLLRDGTAVQVPSFVFDKDEMESLASAFGLTLVNYRTVSVEELPRRALSPKLQDSVLAPVIDGYVFVKH